MYKFVLFLFIFVVVSCGKIELPSDNTGDGNTTPTDSVNVDKVYSVSELASVDAEDIIYVKGFIVGYIPKNGSMARTSFSINDEDIVASNVVIADNKSETDYKQCAPIQLLANSEVRIILNLVDNPDNLGKCVIICGKKQTYYNYAGLKPAYSCQFVDDSLNGGDTPPSDMPPLPTLSSSEEEVFEGC